MTDTTQKTYLVPWSIDGIKPIEATSEEEAQAKLWEYSQKELAEEGMLEVHSPRPPKDPGK